ncbi:hypothetical protein C7B61_02735 [filamentous cyanobacterium CCP1]|nr:hypothetical protein C7B76_08185 [filamentous cyanobacterium CCP2]PSB68083.1 hypothetical protein C7B61_02735 [filamentous cyanobacterium CCP1]
MEGNDLENWIGLEVWGVADREGWIWAAIKPRAIVSKMPVMGFSKWFQRVRGGAELGWLGEGVWLESWADMARAMN